MDSGLKQRLVGAAVLVALAVIFLPLLVQGPAPDSGVSDVPLSMPDAPDEPFETRDLPLVTPGATPDGGAVGMDIDPAAPDSGVAAADRDAAGIAAASAAPAATSSPAPMNEDDAAEVAPPPAAKAVAMFPAATAGGDFAVSFGSFSSTAAAEAVVASLRASQLPGYRESARVDGKTVQRVRIGPYASRAQAEAARLRAAHVRDDVGAQVVVLDADVAESTPAPAPTPIKPVMTASAPTPTTVPEPAAPPAAASTGFAVQLAAFSKPADAIALRDKVRAAGFNAFTEAVNTDNGTLTRVRVGPVVSRAEADQLKTQVKTRLGIDGIVRPHP